MKKFFTIVAALSFFVVKTNAQSGTTQGKDDFIYTAGSITTASSNWTTLSGTANQLSITTGGLTYSGYNGALNATGNNKLSLVAANTEDVNMLVAPVTTGTVYVSYILNVASATGLLANTGAGDYFSGISPNVGSTSYTARTFLRQGSTSGYQIGVKFNSNALNGTTWATGVGDNMTFGTSYLIVIRYTYNTGSTADDVIDLWVNPTLGVSPPTSLVSITNTGTTVDLTSVGAFFLRQATNTPTLDVDGLLVGTTWNAAPLPATIKNFSANLFGSTASINWSTTNEVNLNGYTVEKSTNGTNFTSIGFVGAKNTVAANYTFTDVINGLSYYRIKVQDKDGNFKYSQVVVLNTKKSTKLEVFPNPVVNNIVLSHTTATENTSIKIATIDGKIINSLNVQAGAIQTSVDVSKLIKGNYIVTYYNGVTKAATQFVKL